MISLLEAGFFPYADFSLGLLAGALAFAALRVCPRCDATYALASVWALLGVVHNQTSAGSTWGCASYICTAKCVDGTFGICARDGTSVGGLPVGFKSLCAGYAPGDVDRDLYRRFRWWLLQNNQINGSVWKELWP